jgi:hypothetical protein
VGKKRTFNFYKLLHDIEYEIGSECYNGNIQNFGPGGVWEGAGRDFRYPVRFMNSEGEREQYRGKLPFTKSTTGDMAHAVLAEERYDSAHYAFGANQLYILRGIERALVQIEERFKIDFDALLEAESESKKNA